MRPIGDTTRIRPLSRVRRVRHTPPATDDTETRPLPPRPEPAKPYGPAPDDSPHGGRVDEYA